MPRHTRRTAAAAAAAAAAAEPTEPAETNEGSAKGSAEEPASKRPKTEPEPIGLGDQIPEGEVVDQDGKTVNLAKQYNSGVLALYAYPKASTPGCTRQTIGFGNAFSELASLGVTVFGISADSPTSQTTFKTKTGINFNLLSDPEYTLLAPLGAKKSPKGVIRSHWVFIDGKALLVEHQVKPDASPDRVVSAIKEAIAEGTNGNAVQEDSTRIESDSASGKPESAKDLAKEPLQKLDDGASAEETETSSENATEKTEEKPTESEKKSLSEKLEKTQESQETTTEKSESKPEVESNGSTEKTGDSKSD